MMDQYFHSTDRSFVEQESSAAHGVTTPTTAKTDTLAEYMRGALIVDTNRLTVDIEDIDFSRIEYLG
jgi:hypothetical protein